MSKGQFKRLYFIIIYFISVSDRLLAPSFDCIYFIAHGKGDNNVKEVYLLVEYHYILVNVPIAKTQDQASS